MDDVREKRQSGPHKGGPQKGKAKKGGSSADGAPNTASLLELQLAELERGLRVSPPELGVDSSPSAVLWDFVSFLKQFCLNEFRARQIALDAPAAAAAATKDPKAPFSSPLATAIFSQVPGNAKATPPLWTAPQPCRVELIGSCGAGMGPPSFARNLDLALELPEDALDKRDYLNYRYLAKRAAYVDMLRCQLQEALAKQQQQQQQQQQQWAWACACKRARLRVEAEVRPWRLDGLKTVLCVKFLPLEKETVKAKETAAADGSTAAADAHDVRAQQRLFRQLQSWEVRLFVACCGGLFKEKFLRPNANAVRRRTTATKDLKETANKMETPLTDAQVKALPPTPYYNGLVLEDCRFFKHAEILRKCAAEFTGFASAVRLLKAWARRRSLLDSGLSACSSTTGKCCFSVPLLESPHLLFPPCVCCGFTLSLILAHVCLASGDVARVAAPVQLFRLALSFLGGADFRSRFYCMGEDAGRLKPSLPEEANARLEAAVAARNDAADAVAAPLPGAGAAAEDAEKATHMPQWGRQELCVGLVEDAYLFDSEEKTFNILWRSQLHIQELQHEARSSLAALQKLDDPFSLLFGEQQEHLLLKSDLWVHVPALPPRGQAYELETSIPVGNYDPPSPDRRHVPQGPAYDDGDASSSGDDPTHFDPPKWETAPAFLGAATLARIIVRGLGDRMQSFRVRFALSGGPTQAPRLGNSFDTLPVGVVICITLNGKASARLLDRGPSVVDATEVASQTPRAVAADSFRKFWGPRCDVRRFQDGRMLHCVLWEKFVVFEGPQALDRASGEAAGQRTPPEQIVRYVLQRHAEDICCYAASLTKTEPNVAAKKQSQRLSLGIHCSPLGPNGPLSDRQKALVRAFAELKNLLCSLSSIPLTIKQVWHSDAALRHTEVFSSNIWEPEKAAAATVHSVVVQFEDSGKWPVEREAVCKLKTAFLVAMNEELLRDYSVSSNVMESFLDIHFQSFIFRVQIFHPNEVMEEANIFTDFSLKPITLHLGKAHSGPANSGRETLTFSGGSTDEQKVAKQVCDVLLQEDVALLSAVNPYHMDKVLHLRSLWWAPQAAALVHSLALKHTAFAGAVRLAVSWLSKQLIVGAVHFAEHVLAFLFVDYMRAGYGNEPQSPHVAFLRFLHFVSSFDWEHSPLLVSFDSSSLLTDGQRHHMQASFEHFGHVPSVHSVLDPHGFILPRPDPPSFRRLLGCARDCCQKIRSIPMTSSRLTTAWKGLFVTDWSQFDIVIKLKDPLAAPQTGSQDTIPQKKRRYANLAFNNDTTDTKKESVLGGLLQREASADLPLLSSQGLRLSPASPETAAVLDDLLLRAVGSKACTRRYLFLRFLRRLFQAFPDAFVLGLDFVQAQQLAGGLPDSIALKIPPATLLCRALQPIEVSPRLLLCPSWEAQKAPTTGRESFKEGSSSPSDERAFMAVLSPSMLLGGIKAIATGMIETVVLT
ncbi:uncharacterized protein EMH_0041240 [Eimeria mitis]|uniref:Nucleolar protein 6 n=1 Tax=Eimeria mitis TaxID=44415 RepID=U6KHE6_9EIME|nr:uncharacterized protein EMH_0041240 [Eimeria mitis]CDJ36221.1 hypothetical protein, conserved [Eimeria mitis]